MLQILVSNFDNCKINKGLKHKVFKDSYGAKAINSDKFLFQKINYIHGNPVISKCTLAKNNVC